MKLIYTLSLGRDSSQLPTYLVAALYYQQLKAEKLGLPANKNMSNKTGEEGVHLFAEIGKVLGAVRAVVP